MQISWRRPPVTHSPVLANLDAPDVFRPTAERQIIPESCCRVATLGGCWGGRPSALPMRRDSSIDCRPNCHRTAWDQLERAGMTGRLPMQTLDGINLTPRAWRRWYRQLDLQNRCSTVAPGYKHLAKPGPRSVPREPNLSVTRGLQLASERPASEQAVRTATDT
jgi:hypothetical protein